MKQVLSVEQRRSIRADLYASSDEQITDTKDGKIKFFLKYTKNKNVLDLGCVDHNPENRKSKFWLHKAIKSVANKVVGLDYYEVGVDELQKQGFDVHYGDAQDFSFTDIFDIISAGDLVEHLPNPGGMFVCSSKYLKDNGFLLVSTPNVFCWKYVLYFFFHGHSNRINQEHVSWYDITTLCLLANRYGFKKVELKYTSRRWWEKLVPLPTHIKHTTINLAFKKSIQR